MESLNTDAHGEVSGDLFVDCSGSRALVLSEHFGGPFSSKCQFLFNDTALAAQIPCSNDDEPIASST